MLMLVRKFYSPDDDPAGGKPEGNSDKKDGEKGAGEADTVARLTKALNDARKNSVSKEDFDKLKAEKDALVTSIIEGGDPVGSGQKEKPKADIAALREKLYGPKCSELSNLDYWKTTLELRAAVMAEGKEDPFLPHGANIKPTNFDAERAEAVASEIQKCIDESEGDSGVFTALLQSKINNDSPALTAHLKKMGLIK